MVGRGGGGGGGVKTKTIIDQHPSRCITQQSRTPRLRARQVEPSGGARFVVLARPRAARRMMALPYNLSDGVCQLQSAWCYSARSHLHPLSFTWHDLSFEKIQRVTLQDHAPEHAVSELTHARPSPMECDPPRRHCHM